MVRHTVADDNHYGYKRVNHTPLFHITFSSTLLMETKKHKASICYCCTQMMKPISCYVTLQPPPYLLCLYAKLHALHVSDSKIFSEKIKNSLKNFFCFEKLYAQTANCNRSLRVQLRIHIISSLRISNSNKTINKLSLYEIGKFMM